jgi:uncharacterized protein YecT (DUF1311 family)
MMKYYSAALDRYSDNEKMTAEIKRSQITWESYAEANCGAVWASFGDGSYRNRAFTICKDDLARLRTNATWSSFLGFVDTTPPVLPEPKL